MRNAMVLFLGIGLGLGQLPGADASAPCPRFASTPTKGTATIEVITCEKDCKGREITVKLKRSDDSDSPKVWIGDLLKPVGEVREGGGLLVFFDDGVQGLVYLNAEMYRVTSSGLGIVQPFSLPGEMKVLGRSVHLEKIDPGDLPGTHPTSEAGEAAAEATVPAVPAAPAEMDYIDLVLIYSEAAQSRAEDSGGYGGYELHAELVEAVTNWTFKNHGLKIRVRVDAKPASLPNGGGGEPKLANYEDYLSTWLKSNPVSSLDEAIDVIGWVDDYKQGEACGKTHCGGGVCLGAQCSAHFAVSFRCAVEKFMVAHELGHILGADHHPVAFGPGESAPFEYGQAACSGRCDHHWATIMGNIHRTSRKPCEPKSAILPFWSTPDRCFLDEPLGKSGRQENVRIIAENARKLADVNLSCVEQTFSPQDSEPSNTEP